MGTPSGPASLAEEAPLAGAPGLAQKASIIEGLVGDGTSPVAVFLLAPARMPRLLPTSSHSSVTATARPS